ncbi:MAG TPA: glycoside hydrolase family 3 N-terminal domain-containing protein [Bryobacteraceae bacterium]|nr:glycoside hydrolase family 3 N-terminal domain-containing protein [Bryobacteraceae bacterium]
MTRSVSLRLAVVLCAAAMTEFWFSRQPASAASEPKPLSSYDPQVKQLLSQMTLEEKIGQMTQAESTPVLKNPSDIEDYKLGSILSGGSADPREGNSVQAWAGMYNRLQEPTAKTRLKIPLLYGIDAVHGHSNVLGAVIFPHNIGLGCTRDAELVEKVERVTAEEVRATGIQWAFAPCVTVPQDIRWGRTYEGYSENPQVVRELAGAAVRGFQGLDLSDPLAVVACAKHFVGDGGTAFGSSHQGKGLDQGDTRVDEATLRRIHLQGYISAIQAGVATIMPSYSSWNGVKCSADKHLLTDLLKNELGFQGFLISDYNAIDQISPNYKNDVETSINAGMDMLMVPSRYKEFIRDLKQLVNEGKVPMSRIDDAVTRILRVKFAAGLMDAGRSQLARPELQKAFGSAEHRQVARQAVRESLVLLKNKGNMLPLSKTATRIHVAGKSADDLGNQCGGWTIDWQGRSGNVTTGGTTVLAAIKGVVSRNTQVTYSLDGTGAAGATVGVVVIGERPYAEGAGDRADLSLAPEDVTAVNNMKTAGIPVVVIVFSGRPLILGSVLNQADALVAAWLPGTEGEGITDVLFGDSNFTGKLSFTWPRSMAQVPSNVNHRQNYDPLFPFGYGLTYQR